MTIILTENLIWVLITARRIDRLSEIHTGVLTVIIRMEEKTYFLIFQSRKSKTIAR